MADDNSPTYSPDHFPSSPEEDSVEVAKKMGKTNMLQWMEIRVSEPEKRTTTAMKMTDTYMVYLVETRIMDNSVKCKGDGTTSLWRRYSEFEILRNYLDIMHPALVIPPLPEKKATYTWQNMATDKFEPEFIERRRAALEPWNGMSTGSSMSVNSLNVDCIVHEEMRRRMERFPCIGNRCFQSCVCKHIFIDHSVFVFQAESRLKAISASFRLKKPDKRFEEVKNYSGELQSNIANLLKVRARMADHQYGIHKLHANYHRVFNEWSGIEKDMSEPLQSAGHYMNVDSQSIDAILEEEEQYADQLKEYMAFGESLRSVCRKYECMQYDHERAEDSLASKSSQKEMLAQGKTAGGFSLSGMKKALFGNDTQEQRELKLKHLDEQIKLTEQELAQINEETQKFVEAALRDIDRFKRQKTKDLKEIFTNYAIMQIKQCKKGIAIWTSAKDCFTKM
ncbi:sorting nexin-4-like [Ruditapes philippinarum]|uniref:sorting nexin-4-like n=1 Tax=Ruditapes philippinarum TaxID=129788 RepID=UPI00295A629E|nr:sorting nexin-4-like [Ruditapes philippinarum]